MSSTIILSNPEGPKELLITFAMAWVARTAPTLSIPLSSEGEINQHTILFPDIGTGDFLSTQDCVRDGSVH